MPDIAASKSKMNDLEISSDAPMTEATMAKLGANVNYLINTTDNHGTRITANDAKVGANVLTYNASGGTGTGTSITFTTPNTKQIYFAVAWGAGGFAGAFSFCLQGQSVNNGTFTASIGGTNNRSLTVDGNPSTGNTFGAVIFYEA